MKTFELKIRVDSGAFVTRSYLEAKSKRAAMALAKKRFATELWFGGRVPNAIMKPRPDLDD